MPCHGFFLHISIHKSIECLEGDICDPSLVSKIFVGLDSVFHEAILVPVPLSCEKPAKLRINILLRTLRVLQACMEVDGKKLVILSSASGHWNNLVLPKREDVSPWPVSSYTIFTHYLLIWV